MINYHENLSLENLFYLNEKGLVCSEEFRDVPGYEGRYQVSNLGRVKTLNYKRTKQHRILKQKDSGNGYVQCSLYGKEKVSQTKTHQLVAMAFYGHVPCGHKKVVDHKNQVRFGNNADNLQIVTQRQNTNQEHLKSSSQYVGVHWSKDRNKWRSAIRTNEKRIILGSFDNEEEASEYYQNALKAIENGNEIIVKRRITSSKHKGITWYKKGEKWNCRIFINKKRISLGYFPDEKQAVIFYNKAFENKHIYSGDNDLFRQFLNKIK